MFDHPASSSTVSIPWAALVPVLILLVLFTVYCLVDMVRHRDVKHLPLWLWVLLCLASEPLGGILYLLLGRSEDR